MKLPNCKTEQKIWNLNLQENKHSKFIIIFAIIINEVITVFIITLINIIIIIIISSLINIWTILADPDPVLSLRGRGWEFFPATKNVPQLLSKENYGRKTEPKETPSCLIPRLLLVFSWQLKILVTTLQTWGGWGLQKLIQRGRGSSRNIFYGARETQFNLRKGLISHCKQHPNQ